MAVSIDTHMEILTLWLVKVAENTARVRDAVEKAPGSGGAGSSAKPKKAKSEWKKRLENVMQKLDSSMGH